MSTEAIAVGGRQELRRAIDWRGAFWVASGVPALVLFSIGGIAGTTGKLAFLVWIISMVMGFLQSLHLCRDCRPVWREIGWRLDLRRDRLAALLQADRSPVGMVQLVRLVSGAVARLRHCRKLYAQRLGADPGG